MRPSTGLTPLQDAVARVEHLGGTEAGSCSSGLCLEVKFSLLLVGHPCSGAEGACAKR